MLKMLEIIDLLLLLFCRLNPEKYQFWRVPPDRDDIHAQMGKELTIDCPKMRGNFVYVYIKKSSLFLSVKQTLKSDYVSRY